MNAFIYSLDIKDSISWAALLIHFIVYWPCVTNFMPLCLGLISRISHNIHLLTGTNDEILLWSLFMGPSSCGAGADIY